MVDSSAPLLFPPTSAVHHSVRAAQYVRMSTEHQKYSTENQEEAIRAYADRRSIEIVRTFADHGKSGLRWTDGMNCSA